MTPGCSLNIRSPKAITCLARHLTDEPGAVEGCDIAVDAGRRRRGLALGGRGHKH